MPLPNLADGVRQTVQEKASKRDSLSTATIARALAHADSFTLKRKYDAVVVMTDWESINIQFADPIPDSLRKDFGDLFKSMGSYNPWIEQPANSESPINHVFVNISKLYDIEEAAETIAAELERQGLKVLRRDDRAMPRSTVVTFAKLDSLEDREDAKKTLRKIGGKRPGKKCGNSYVSADKQCKGHSSKTESGKRKLTAAGKKSAEELAAKVRARKGMAAIGEKRKPDVKQPPKTKKSGAKKAAVEAINKELAPLTKDKLGQDIMTAIAKHGLDHARVGKATGYNALQTIEGKSYLLDREVESVIRKLRNDIYPDLEDKDIAKKVKKTLTPDLDRRLKINELVNKQGFTEEQADEELKRKEYKPPMREDSLEDREDAKKTLRKIGGKRPGKKCKGSYISADKKCSSDYGLTPSGKRKLTDMGKKSAVELANKVRQQRGLTAVTREGSGQPLPFDRKSRQSASIAKATMSVKDRREKLRREFDPNSSGKRAEMIAKKEEKRAIVGLGGSQKAMEEADAVALEKPKMTVVKGGLSDENLGSKLLEEIYKTNISSFTGWSPTIKSAKGQGKRSGQRMVKGSMGDATGVPGGLTFKPPGMNKGEQQEFTLLDNLQREYYTKAKAKGLDHDTSMMAAYAVGANGSIQEFGAFARSKNLSPIDEKLKSAQNASQDKALAKMSMGELFKESDRVGSKYQSPNDPIDLAARRQAAEILKETGVTKAIDRASGKVRSIAAPKPKTTQMAQLQALREAKIKSGTFKRSVDSAV